ncbi:hypothetical protein, partial [Limosilactobacillus reuteri]|uniref:hypothetical protein n=1 Tax=Limosilactobacillus reuteri TaxID=1598 RepID=UPI001E451BF4
EDFIQLRLLLGTYVTAPSANDVYVSRLFLVNTYYSLFCADLTYRYCLKSILIYLLSNIR